MRLENDWARYNVQYLTYRRQFAKWNANNSERPNAADGAAAAPRNTRRVNHHGAEMTRDFERLAVPVTLTEHNLNVTRPNRYQTRALSGTPRATSARGRAKRSNSASSARIFVGSIE